MQHPRSFFMAIMVVVATSFYYMDIPTTQVAMAKPIVEVASCEVPVDNTDVESYSEKQHRLLRIAYEKGVKVGVEPKLVQAVILQETLAGGLKSYKVGNPKGEPYYGVGQIKLVAAKDVLKRNPELYEEYGFHTRTDDEIIAHLILDEKFNIEVAARYLKVVQSYGYKGAAVLVAYNKGPGGAKGVDVSKNKYATEAMRKFRESSIAQSFH